MKISKCECKNCGHIGIPIMLQDTEKCSKCLSRYVFEVNNKDTQ